MAISPRKHKAGDQSRSSVTAVLAAISITTAITAALYIRVSLGESHDNREAMPVSVTEFAITASYSRDLPFLGLIRARRSTDVGFEVPGLLAELLVTEGSAVSAGDTLGHLDTSRLRTRRSAAAANLQRVRSELELARLKSQRQKDLSVSGAVSKEAYDETRLTAQALTAQLAAVSADLDGIDIELIKSELTAPYNGVVAARYVNQGAVVSAGTVVVRLVASEGREAHIGVAVEHAALLLAGDSYNLKLRDQTVPARLRSVRPDVDPATLTTTAVFELPTGINALDGEPVSLLLSETVTATGGWLPVSALIEGERGIWNVYRLVQGEGKSVTAREIVEVLEIRGGQVFVRGTLADGEYVISDGLHRIAAGTPVIAKGL